MEQTERKEMAYVLHMLQALMTRGRTHTIEDILALPEGKRAELIDGEMFMMASPTWTHQQILSWLHVAIYTHIHNHKGKCQVGLAPFAVFLKNDDKNYVEPDLAVICSRNKLDDQGCHGAPDWVIEIVSPSSITMDYKRKLKAYEEAGVKEYWIIDYPKDTITVHRFPGKTALEDETDQGAALVPKSDMYHFSDTIQSGILEDLKINFQELKELLTQ